MTRPSFLLAGVMALGLGACATTDGKGPERSGDAMGDAVSQPFKDLSLMRETTSPVLARAAKGPYAAEDPVPCAAVAAEIAELDAALGPDLDARGEAETGAAEAIIFGALRGALDLPFRGIIRRVSGAEKRDRVQARAVLAGMVRRGFLKGLARAAGCPAQ
jgi:hypothetical protein